VSAPRRAPQFNSSFVVARPERRRALVCDPQAPLEHGCPVVLLDKNNAFMLEGTIATKHPAKARTLNIKFSDSGGSSISGVRASSGDSAVVRVVAEFALLTSYSAAHQLLLSGPAPRLVGRGCWSSCHGSRRNATPSTQARPSKGGRHD
jgi:hypothetical protein